MPCLECLAETHTRSPLARTQAASQCLEGCPRLLFFLPSRDLNLGRYRKHFLPESAHEASEPLGCLELELPRRGGPAVGLRSLPLCSPLWRCAHVHTSDHGCRNQALQEEKNFLF